jgi:cystathionine gamma-synthase
MLSFDLKGGIGHLRHFLKALKVFTLAESLWGIESLVAHHRFGGSRAWSRIRQQ